MSTIASPHRPGWILSATSEDAQLRRDSQE
jgi:hypothetical protein